MRKLDTPLNLKIDGYSWSTNYVPGNGAEILTLVLFSGKTSILSKNIVVDDAAAKLNEYADAYYDGIAKTAAEELIIGLDALASPQS